MHRVLHCVMHLVMHYVRHVVLHMPCTCNAHAMHMQCVCMCTGQVAKEIWVCENKGVRRYDGSIHDYKRELAKKMGAYKTL